MKKFFSIVAVAALLGAHTVQAQTDAKAKSILDAVAKKVNGLKSFKANFALHLTGGKGGKVTDSKKGTVAVKGQKYHVVLSAQEIICDTRNVWTYNKDAKEVQMTNYNPGEQTMSPAKLFTNFYDKEYRYTYKGEAKANGKTCDVIEMIPLDKSKQFSKIELMIDKASSMVTGGNIWEKNGNKYEYAISNFTPNANVSDNDFTWNKAAHPGVELVDMR